MINYNRSRKVLSACGVLGLGVSSAVAELMVPAFFSDGMVLQQEIGAKVWGYSDQSAKVDVEFAGQKLSSPVGDDGKWMVNFEDLKANKEGQTLTITSAGDKRVINDVVVGEVWIASGQSNMEWTMKKSNGAAEAKKAKDDLLRVYYSKNVTASSPARDFEGSWRKTEPANTSKFTAVGYYYAKALREQLDVPVGIIECSWGGKPVEAFTSDEVIHKTPEAKPLIEKKENLKHLWKNQPKNENPKAKKKVDPELDPKLHSTIYNGMIAPIAGYGARGAIWYQGEANANPVTAENYGELLQAMISDWRSRWGSDLSFYYVQLANFARDNKNMPVWITVQDEMRRLLDESDGVGMAVINDIGERTDIHPKNKKDVAARLALWALKNDYGKEVKLYSGPIFEDFKVDGANIEVSFDQATGLKTRDGKALGGFEIIGESNEWLPAEAEIRGEKVIVSNKSVKKPKNLRYAWLSDPKDANLVNEAGLPTSVFIGLEK